MEIIPLSPTLGGLAFFAGFVLQTWDYRRSRRRAVAVQPVARTYYVEAQQPVPPPPPPPPPEHVASEEEPPTNQ